MEDFGKALVSWRFSAYKNKRGYLYSTPDSVAAMLENIVYLELLRRGYDVYIGKLGNAEIDFVATKQESKLYIQVTQEICSSET